MLITTLNVLACIISCCIYFTYEVEQPADQMKIKQKRKIQY